MAALRPITAACDTSLALVSFFSSLLLKQASQAKPGTRSTGPLWLLRKHRHQATGCCGNSSRLSHPRCSRSRSELGSCLHDQRVAPADGHTLACVMGRLAQLNQAQGGGGGHQARGIHLLDKRAPAQQQRVQPWQHRQPAQARARQRVAATQLHHLQASLTRQRRHRRIHHRLKAPRLHARQLRPERHHVPQPAVCERAPELQLP
mmetsp:Transcript_34599/g.87520  ORF Transcript_34599/g.87520 Transcript_34599/m.87520 type:complete len:205 (+) Transcript_34599:626-1240(+)